MSVSEKPEKPTYSKGLRLCVVWRGGPETVVQYGEGRTIEDLCREVHVPVDRADDVLEAWVEDSEGTRVPEVSVVMDEFVPQPGVTYWGGQPTPCRRVVVRVGRSLFSTWWCADLEGTRRKAVEVTYGGKVFFLDDQDGSGWAKVTSGSDPRVAYWYLPDGSTVVHALM